MANNVNNPTKVITGPDTRWSYCNAWEPKAINGGEPKYSVSLIIPKSDKKTIAKIEAAIEAAYREGEAKLKGNGRSVPALSVLKTPLRDGDTERPDDEAYADSYFVNANSTTAPGIVDTPCGHGSSGSASSGTNSRPQGRSSRRGLQGTHPSGTEGLLEGNAGGSLLPP